MQTCPTLASASSFGTCQSTRLAPPSPGAWRRSSIDELKQLAPTLLDLFVSLGDTKWNSDSTDETNSTGHESTVFSFNTAKCTFPESEGLSAIH